MANIIGRFYFKLTKSGNLLGEFSNNLSTRNEAESANLIGICTNTYIGTYESSWGSINDFKLATLTIDYKPNSNGMLYSLIWTDSNNPIFRGEGFIVDDILIGDYARI